MGMDQTTKIITLFCFTFIFSCGIFAGVIGVYLVGKIKKWRESRRAASIVNNGNDPATHFSRVDALEQMRAMTPVDFEKFIGTMFTSMGYQADTTKITGDHGVDLYLRKDGRIAIVQCKRYNDGNQISEGTVRDFYGSMLHERAYEGYFITTSTFSMPARQWAHGKFLHLVDGRELSEWAKTAHEKPPVTQAVMSM